MLLISWNVNGIRAVLGKGDFLGWLETSGADVICLQETKIDAGEFSKIRTLFEDAGFHLAEAHAEKRGYSGVLTLSRGKPISVRIGVGEDEFDAEGRTVVTEYPDFFVINGYFPNARDDLSRLDFRLRYDEAIRRLAGELGRTKPVVITGDLNVAHREIDLRHPGPNRGKKGFTDEERASFDAFLSAGFVDTFRAAHGDEPEKYSWWSYRAGARRTNAGWRIDYFLASSKLKARIQDAGIMTDVLGSDHTPVWVRIA